MKQLKTVLILCLGANLVACSQAAFSTIPTVMSVPAALNVSDAPIPDMSCLINTPDYILKTSVDSFALTGGGNGSVGFSLGGILSSIGFGVTYSTGTLDMSMNMVQPLYSSIEIANSTGSADSSNMSFDVSAVIAMVGGSVGSWQTTGMYDLSQNALTSTYGNLAKNLPSLPWSTVISQDLTQGNFLLPVGQTSGLQVGDTFTVYRVNYVWGGSGAPCANPLEIVQKKSVIATATVSQLSVDSALVHIDKPRVDVLKYDWLEIKALVQPTGKNAVARTTLKHTLHVARATQSAGLTFSDGKTTQAVDMTGFVSSQVSNYLVNTLGAYVLR